MTSRGASDFHLTVGRPPMLRVSGSIEPIRYRIALRGRLHRAAASRSRRRGCGRSSSPTGDVDFAYEIAGVARFRVNLFRQQRGSGAVFRVIPTKIMTLEQLGLPDQVRRLATMRSGLVLVTGPTGSGKSTTLAAIIDLINETAELPHHHDRGPDRVRAPEQEVPDPPARDRHARDELRRGAEGGGPRGPGPDPGRRDARPRDDLDGARRGREGHARLRHAAHQQRRQDHATASSASSPPASRKASATSSAKRSAPSSRSSSSPSSAAAASRRWRSCSPRRRSAT